MCTLLLKYYFDDASENLQIKFFNLTDENTTAYTYYLF